MTVKSFNIGDRLVGPEAHPLIIAEMSGNHNGDLKRALEIVDMAAKAGADALKIQTYTADTMTLDLAEGEFRITDEKSLWSGETLYQLYEKAHTPWDWHKPIFDRCKEHGMLGFSSPFDPTAVDFLSSLNVPAFKIASFEILDLPLIRKAASTGKPLIISTGLATENEIDEAVQAARQAGCRDLMILKCTSSYPADPAFSNLKSIPYIQERFGCLVGLSDHTPGIGAAVGAVALGAVAIEKHVTMRRADGGVDSAFSLEPEELQLLVNESRIARAALGSAQLGPSEHEKASLQFRRTLYVVRDVKAGAILTADDIRPIRPGFGLAPKHLETVLGKITKVAIQRGTPLSFDLLSD
jgi:pseudaminic acid synthase